MEHRFNAMCEYVLDTSECIYKNHTRIFDICMMSNQIQKNTMPNEDEWATFIRLTFFYVEFNQFTIVLGLLTGIIYVYFY